MRRPTPRTKGELSEALHGRVSPELEPWCDVCDVHHVPEPLLRLAGMAGTFCYGWPQGTRQMLMATDVWLGEPLGGDVRSGRVELARGSCTPTGRWPPPLRLLDRHRHRGRTASSTSATSWWRCGWTAPGGCWPPTWTSCGTRRSPASRLLPPGDPFLAQRDRSTLIPDRTVQRAVWRPAGSPAWC